MAARRFKLLRVAAWRCKRMFDAAIGAAAVGTLHAAKRMDRKRSANMAGALMRKIGPLRREHRIGRDNLRAAFPDKSDAEIETILAGVWGNLGRVAAEFAHLDEFQIEGLGRSTPDTVRLSPETLERAARIEKAAKPAIGFACHLANWEISALAAKLYGAKSAVLYRRPNIAAVGNVVTRLREPLMGELVRAGLDAPVRLARLLQSGVHVGMLVDQHYAKGVPVTFFGRSCLANPLAAVLARQTECPIHGMRVVRLPDGNSFWGEVTDAIDPPRGADGRIDIAGTMQAITSVIEGWVREHPEQWLWLHRRWRPKAAM
jgi:KDO2-lipid IV(A) lauroyltransferase